MISSTNVDEGVRQYLATAAKGEKREISTTNLDGNWYNNILDTLIPEMMVKEWVEQIKFQNSRVSEKIDTWTYLSNLLLKYYVLGNKIISSATAEAASGSQAGHKHMEQSIRVDTTSEIVPLTNSIFLSSCSLALTIHCKRRRENALLFFFLSHNIFRDNNIYNSIYNILLSF